MSLDNKYLNTGDKDYQLKVEELKELYETDKKKLIESFNKSKEIYLQQVKILIIIFYQIDSLTEKNNEHEHKLHFEKADLEKELLETKIKLDETNTELMNIMKKNKNLNDSSLYEFNINYIY